MQVIKTNSPCHLKVTIDVRLGAGAGDYKFFYFDKEEKSWEKKRLGMKLNSDAIKMMIYWEIWTHQSGYSITTP